MVSSAPTGRPRRRTSGSMGLIAHHLELDLDLRPQSGRDLHDSLFLCRRFFSMITLLMNAAEGLADSTSARLRPSIS